MESLLPELELALGDVEMWGCGDVQKMAASLFPHIPKSSHPHIFLEIGFGAGEHLAHQAALHPDVGIIGCEPYINGVASLLQKLAVGSRQLAEKKEDCKLQTANCQLSNVRIYQGDARLLIEKLPNHSIDKIFINYPDPWPKARHHKRRLISMEFLDALARVMKPGAELRLATDDEDYGTWMLEHLLSHPAFQWTAKTCDDWLNPWRDWISTRYEQKALKAGRGATYLSFERI